MTQSHHGKQLVKHGRNHPNSKEHQKPHPKEHAEELKGKARSAGPGPWSDWTLDRERRGFWFRCRRNPEGDLQYEFRHAVHDVLQLPLVSCDKDVPYHPQWRLLTYGYSPSYATSALRSDSSHASGSEVPHDYDAEDGISDMDEPDIPMIIDVDEENNVKVLVPDPNGGEPTIVWDERSKTGIASHKRVKISPRAKVKEWLPGLA